MISTIAFTSTRDNPTLFGPALEIYLMDADGTNVRRLTENTTGEAFAALSPDGKGKIVFDSNRLFVPPEPANTSLLISSYDIGGSGADPPLEQVSFNFAKIDYEFRPQRADGSLAKPIHAGWDLKLNKKV